MATAWRRVITRRRAGEGASGVGCIRSSPSCPPPRIRRLRRRTLLALVVEDDAARFQRPRFGELEFQPPRLSSNRGFPPPRTIGARQRRYSSIKPLRVSDAERLALPKMNRSLP